VIQQDVYDHRSKQGERQRNVTIHKQEHTADKLNGANKKLRSVTE
jgi:hypothetical protein